MTTFLFELYGLCICLHLTLIGLYLKDIAKELIKLNKNKNEQ